jgi:hypothetical protein
MRRGQMRCWMKRREGCVCVGGGGAESVVDIIVTRVIVGAEVKVVD